MGVVVEVECCVDARWYATHLKTVWVGSSEAVVVVALCSLRLTCSDTSEGVGDMGR